MADDLLLTKLRVPLLRQNLVARPHLIGQMNQSLRAGHKLTLVAAPAGFGKTSMVTVWLNQITQDQSRNDFAASTAWLSLDEADNDPKKFLSYLVAALQIVQADLCETASAMLHAPQMPPLDSILTALLNGLAGFTELPTQKKSLILVLDDYHVIAARPIHDAVSFLLDNLPPNLYLVITSRSDPPLPLSRLRVRDQMVEIRAEALRFSPDECASFLNDIMGLSLSREQVAALESRTEGWIAGLQLAGLSLRGRKSVQEFIDAFSGSHRFVIDYLSDEVFRRLDEETQTFLCQTSILEQLNPSLCDAVTGRSDSQAVLDKLDQSNLFLIPLDDERRWYRYHRLLSGSMRQRLEIDHQNDISQLHRRASAWYAGAGFTGQAVQHAFLAKDLELAAVLVEQHGMTALNQGELVTLVGWLNALPGKQVASRPWLSVARAWTSLLTGKTDEVAPALGFAAEAVAGHETETSDPILGHVASIRAYIAMMAGDRTNGARFAQEALEKLPRDDMSTRSVVSFTLAGAHLLAGDIANACQQFARAGAEGKASGNIHLAVPALSTLGMLQIQCGALGLAARTFDEALQAAKGPGSRLLPIASGAHNGHGRVCYEWNDLDAAAEHLETAVNMAETWGNVDSMISGRLFLALVHLAKEEFESALDCQRQAGRLAQGKQISPTTASLLAAVQINTHLRQGRLDQAASLAADGGLSASDDPIYIREEEYIALARVLIAQDRLTEAASLLERLLQSAQAGGRNGRVIEILLLQAIARLKQDDDFAVDTVAQALELAEPEGYLRTFIDAGPPVRQLLEKAAAAGIRSGYAEKLLSNFVGPRPAKLRPDEIPPTQPVAEQLFEPLTTQELKILRLIAAGMSNREAGEQLFLSINTVKWYVKNIYGKLQVRSRMEAVMRAQELGLL